MGGQRATRIEISLPGTQRQNDVGTEVSRALMEQLVVGVLADGPGRAPENRRGVMFDRLPLGRHALAITLHGELLQKVGQVGELLSVRQHHMGIGAQIVGLPYLEQRHDHRQVGSGR